MSLDKIDTSTNEGFAFRLEREHSVFIHRNRTTLDTLQPGWWEVCPIGGFADLETGEVTFTYDPEKQFPLDLLNYALCHEVGHLLECREHALPFYQWRYAVENYEVESEAWERADRIFFNIRGRVDTSAAKAMADFRKLCLDTYAARAADPREQERVRQLLERGRLGP